MICRSCEQEFSFFDHTTDCPHCGCPLSDHELAQAQEDAREDERESREVRLRGWLGPYFRNR